MAPVTTDVLLAVLAMDRAGTRTVTSLRQRARFVPTGQTEPADGETVVLRSTWSPRAGNDVVTE